jgi:hypothetical protein
MAERLDIILERLNKCGLVQSGNGSGFDFEYIHKNKGLLIIDTDGHTLYIKIKKMNVTTFKHMISRIFKNFNTYKYVVLDDIGECSTLYNKISELRQYHVSTSSCKRHIVLFRRTRIIKYLGAIKGCKIKIADSIDKNPYYRKTHTQLIRKCGNNLVIRFEPPLMFQPRQSDKYVSMSTPFYKMQKVVRWNKLEYNEENTQGKQSVYLGYPPQIYEIRTSMVIPMLNYNHYKDECDIFKDYAETILKYLHDNAKIIQQAWKQYSLFREMSSKGSDQINDLKI